MDAPKNLKSENIHIDPYNFGNLVPLVDLNASGGSFGEFFCKICKLCFKLDVDTRVLPCEHAFHGKCIYDFLVLQNQKYCPICKESYQ